MKCMVCGNKVGNNDNICTNCGSNLKSQREATFTSVNTIPISNPQNNKQNNGAGKAILIIFLLFFILPMLLPFVMIFMEVGDFFDDIEENIPEVSTRCEEEVNDPYGYWISDNNNYFSINGDQTLYYYDNYYDLTNNITLGSSYVFPYEEALNYLGGEDNLRLTIFNEMRLSAFNYKDVYYIQFYPNRMFQNGIDVLPNNKPEKNYYELLFVYDYDYGTNYATIYNITNNKLYKVTRNAI